MKKETKFELELMTLFKKYNAEMWARHDDFEEPCIVLYYADGEPCELNVEFIDERGICES